MGGIYDFNSAALELSLKSLGIRQTWINILATHLQSFHHLEYVLENKIFECASFNDDDLIEYWRDQRFV